METFKSRHTRLVGSDSKEVKRRAEHIYWQYISNPKRQAYIKSQYFNNDKVFLEYFWQHLYDKRWPDRTRRLKYLPAALDLIRNTHCKPESKISPQNPAEILHKFTGKTHDGFEFYVQIQEHRRTNKKLFISVFPKANK